MNGQGGDYGSYHVGYGYIIIFLHKHAVRLTTGTLVINIINHQLQEPRLWFTTGDTVYFSSMK